MISSFTLIPNVLKFIFSFRSIQVLVSISILTICIFFFVVDRLHGIGTNSVLQFMDKELPFALVALFYNNVYMALTLVVTLLTIQVSEFLFFGHFSQSIICKVRDRVPLLIAYLVATFTIALSAALVYTSYYIPISPSFTHYFFTLLYSSLYFYTIVIGTTLVINFSSIRKYTLLVLIFIFMVVPLTLKLFTPLISSSGLLNNFIKTILIGLERLTSIHIELSHQAESIIKTGLVQDGLLLESIGLMSVYLIIIGYQFMKKDFS